MDTAGVMKAALALYFRMVKIVAPHMAQNVADRAMQVFGGGRLPGHDNPRRLHPRPVLPHSRWPRRGAHVPVGKMTARELNS